MGSAFELTNPPSPSGSSVFVDVTRTHLPAASDYTFALALEDVDGDGDRDALIGNAGQNRLYLNDGQGVFTDVTATHLPVDYDGSQALALEDVDGDGDRDALFGNETDLSRLYLNDGTGYFTDVTATHLPGDNDPTFALALEDVDGDGDRDALIGNFQYPYGHWNRLYLNDGSTIRITGHGTDYIPLSHHHVQQTHAGMLVTHVGTLLEYQVAARTLTSSTG